MEKYYDTPSEEVFNDIKQQSISLWKSSYDDNYGYVSEKVNRINQILNYKDNAMYIVAMFDSNNIQRLLQILGTSAREYVKERIK